LTPFFLPSFDKWHLSGETTKELPMKLIFCSHILVHDCIHQPTSTTMKVTPVIVAMMAGGATAFAPSRPVGTSSFVTMTAPPAIPSYAGSSTALQMNLFDRFFRVAKSNLNLVLNSLEDPEKILNQATEDMQNDLLKIRQSYAEVTANQKRLARQKTQAESLANDWYNRAQLALRSNNEGLAREALTRRQIALDEAATLQQQMDTQGQALDKLYEGMQMLEQRILESKSKKDQMAARAKTAKTTIKVNDMLSGITGKTSMNAFQRMEEKIEALEAAAENSANMKSLFGDALPGSDDAILEKEFARLESSSKIDDELNKMKGLLKEGKAPKLLTSGGSRLEQEFHMENKFRELERESGVRRIPIQEN
jgi:phage shock protein A